MNEYKNVLFYFIRHLPFYLNTRQTMLIHEKVLSLKVYFKVIFDMGSVKYGKESLNKILKYKWQSCYFYDLQISRWLAQFRQYYFCRFSVATSWFLFYQTCWRCCDWARQSLQSLQIHQMSSTPLTRTAKQVSLGHHRVASTAEEQIRKWTHTPGPTLLFQMQSKHGRCLNVKIFSWGNLR